MSVRGEESGSEPIDDICTLIEYTGQMTPPLKNSVKYFSPTESYYWWKITYVDNVAIEGLSENGEMVTIIL